MPGKVTLVGAGPGDPGLLTRKGLEALERADVVVYDRLVSPAILALMPEGAVKINVGKEASRHPVPQEQINRILLEQAQQGHNVVRLKGGDPFLFGRGGEELELLAEHRIPFEEVPGITSAIAAPAYGGIPVTHRDCCSSLHIVTGHQRAGKELAIDFEALVRTGGTLVFLMGVSALPTICAGLLDAGMASDTPAAVVERGTTPAQRRGGGAPAVQSPAVIVVGGVCALADQFDWFDHLPLKGKRVVVTRPRERAGTLSARLRALGADVWEYPCIATVPIVPCPDVDGALERLSGYEGPGAGLSPRPRGSGRGVGLPGREGPGRPRPGRPEAGRHRPRHRQGSGRPRAAGRLCARGLRCGPPGGRSARPGPGAHSPGGGGLPRLDRGPEGA